MHNAPMGIVERLEWLQMGNNNIKSIPSLALGGMHRLRELDLRSNNVSEIEDDSFKGFGNTLKYLSLENNK